MGRILPRERPLRPPGTRRRPSGHGPAERRCRARANLALVEIDNAANEEIAPVVKKAEGEALTLRGNVTQETDVVSALNRTLEHYGKLDSAFNNVGKGPKGWTTCGYELAHI